MIEYDDELLENIARVHLWSEKALACYLWDKWRYFHVILKWESRSGHGNWTPSNE